LGAVSPIFEAMLYLDPELVPGGKEPSVLEVKLPKIKPDNFRTFLSAIYYDLVTVNTTNVTDLLNLSTKYQIEKVLEACSKFLAESLTPENVCEVLESAPHLWADKEFSTLIEENTEEVVNSTSFVRLPKDVVKALLISEKIAASEKILFEAVIRWCNADAKKSESKGQTEATRELIRHVRFPLMTPSEVAVVVTKSGLLTSDELLALYQYVSTNDEKLKAKVKVPFCTTPRPETMRILPAPLEADIYTGNKADGLFNFIGTCGGKKPFTNPVTAGFVKTSTGTWSGFVGFSEKDLSEPFVSAKDNATDIYINSGEINWTIQDWAIDISHYAMRNGGGRGCVLSTWNFEAKVQESDAWEPLYVHTNDTTYSGDGKGGFGTHIFEIKKKDPKVAVWYRYFRIIRKDSTTSTYIHRLDVYGKVRKYKKRS